MSINSYQILINWIRPRRGRQLLGRVTWHRQTVRETRRGGGKVGEGPRGWGSSTAVNLTSPIQPSRAAMLLAVVTLCSCVCLSCASDIMTRGVLARGRVTSTSYELTRIRYNWWELGTKTANFVLSCRIVLIPYLIPRFSHNHQEIFTIVPYSTLIPEAIFHQEGYCRNCTVFHLVFPRLTHIFLYIFIVKYIHNILSLIPY